jgi:hypothetical protein
MHDEEMMDRLLRDAMATDVPQLSPAFDARVLRRVRPRRLTTMGRLVIAAYIVAAAATTLWLMRDLPTVSIVAAVVVGVPAAAGVGAYGRRLAGS